MQSLESYQDRPELSDVVEIANRISIESDRVEKIINDLSGIPQKSELNKIPEIKEALTKAQIPLLFSIIDSAFIPGEYQDLVSEAIDEIPDVSFLKVVDPEEFEEDFDEEAEEFVCMYIRTSLKQTLIRGIECVPTTEE